MRQSGSTWMLVADRRGARLMRGSVVPPGRIHIDSCATVQDVEEEHQHGRPSPRRGKDGHSYASWSSEEKERRRRYAARVAKWLQTTCRQEAVDRLVVFADARLAAELRSHYPRELADRIDEVHLDLGEFEPGRLASHASVRELFNSQDLR